MGQQVPEVLGLVRISLDTPPDETALSRASSGVRGASSAVAAIGATDRPDANEARYDPLAAPPGSMLAILKNDEQISVCEAAVASLSNSLKADLDQNREAFRHRLSVLKAVAAAAATHFESIEARVLAGSPSAKPLDPDISLGMACWSGALTADDLTSGTQASLIDRLDAAPYTATELQTAFAALDLRGVLQSGAADRPAPAPDPSAGQDRHLKPIKAEREAGRQSQGPAGTARASREWTDHSYGDRAADLWDRKAADLLRLTAVLGPDEFQAREVRLAALCTMIGKSYRGISGHLKVKHLCQQELPAGPMREQSLVLRATALCHLIDGAWHVPDGLLEFLPALPAGGRGRDDAIALHGQVYQMLARFDDDGAKARGDRYDAFRAQLARLGPDDRASLLDALNEAYS